MKRILVIISSLFLFISGYSQLRSFRVEIPYPPEFLISDSIQSLAILNNSINHEYQNYDTRDLQIEFYKKNFEHQMLFLDSVVADTTIKVLGEYLFASERFDIVIPAYNTIFRTIPYNVTPEPLDWTFVEEICSTYNTDALIVLENSAIMTATNYRRETDQYSFFVPQVVHSAFMEFYSRSHWRIYYPKTQSIIVDLQMNHDTLYWHNVATDLTSLFRGIPPVKGAAIETATKVAFDFSEKITPKWKSENRYYYMVRDRKVDRSVQLAADGLWAEALENWLIYAETGNRSKRSRVMLNVALAYEMTGDLQNAIFWAKKSADTFYRSVANHYLKELLRRESTTNKGQ